MTAIGHEHHLVRFLNRQATDHRAGFFGTLHRKHSDSASILGHVVAKRSPFPEAILRGHQEAGIVSHHRQSDDEVTFAGLDSTDPGRVSAHRPGLLFVEADTHAPVGHQHNVVFARCQTDSDEFVSFIQLDRNRPRFPVVLKVVEARFLHLARAGCKENITGILTEGDVGTAFLVSRVFETQNGRDGFLRL